jgi:hypothetical protein
LFKKPDQLGEFPDVIGQASLHGKAPNFVALYALRFQVADILVVIGKTGMAQIAEQLGYGIFSLLQSSLAWPGCCSPQQGQQQLLLGFLG